MPPSTSPELASRVFENRHFQAAWALFLFLIVLWGWPIRNALLVFWVYGSAAYFDRGIRVLPGKPIRFSDGVLAPLLPDIVTGIAFFFLTTAGLTLLIFAGLKLYERRISSNAAQQ